MNTRNVSACRWNEDRFPTSMGSTVNTHFQRPVKAQCNRLGIAAIGRSVATIVALTLCLVASSVRAETTTTEPSNAAGIDLQAAKGGTLKAQDGPLTVTTRVQPEEPRLGDVIRLEITAAYPAGFAVNLPTGADFSPLHLVSIESSPEESTGQGLRRKFVVELQSFRLEGTKIPSFELTYVDPQKEIHTHRVASQPLSMRSMTANESEPKRRGEDPPVSPEFPNDRAELAIWATLVGIVLGGALYAFWRWRRSQGVPVPAPPPVPPHMRAHRQLDGLQARADDLFQEGAGVLFYLELTEIAKRYLGDRFGMECLDRTTDEIEVILMREPHRFGIIAADELRRFLRNCDLIKFARVATEVDVARDELTRVRRWVTDTSPAHDTERHSNQREAQTGAET